MRWQINMRVLRKRQPRQLEEARLAGANPMTPNKTSSFSFLNGRGHEGCTDAEGDELAVRRLESPVVLTAVTKVFTNQEQHQPQPGEAQPSSGHSLNDIARQLDERVAHPESGVAIDHGLPCRCSTSFQSESDSSGMLTKTSIARANLLAST